MSTFFHPTRCWFLPMAQWEFSAFTSWPWKNVDIKADTHSAPLTREEIEKELSSPPTFRKELLNTEQELSRSEDIAKIAYLIRNWEPSMARVEGGIVIEPDEEKSSSFFVVDGNHTLAAATYLNESVPVLFPFLHKKEFIEMYDKDILFTDFCNENVQGINTFSILGNTFFIEESYNSIYLYDEEGMSLGCLKSQTILPAILYGSGPVQIDLSIKFEDQKFVFLKTFVERNYSTFQDFEAFENGWEKRCAFL